MKKLIGFLTFLVAVAGIYFYSERDIVTYDLGQNDVVVKNGEYRIIGRVLEGDRLEKIEVYHEDGDKLKESTVDEITEDVLSNDTYIREMRFKKADLIGLQLTKEKVDDKGKIYYHFEHDGTQYKHKLMPFPSKTTYFYWNKIHSQEEK